MPIWTEVTMPSWDEVDQKVREEARKNGEKLLDRIKCVIESENEWLKLKEMYGWSFETAEEAKVVIEGNKRKKGQCAHCTGESALCDGLVLDGHWYCCHDCAAPYRRS
jgi:hypothetical protein